MSDKGSPHILAHQALVHLPRFVEDRDGPIGFDFPNEVDSPGGNGQWLGQARNLSGRQTTLGFGALRLSRSQAPQ